MTTNSKPRILAIDDTPSNLAALGGALEEEFDLQIATSGESGIALATESPPNLILLDVMMPEVDGFQTCRRLKADPALRQIPVIFLTALSDAESESAGLALGAADYIAKPINLAIAKHRIRNLLEREAMHQELAIQRDQLHQFAFFDTLTKLPNRRLLNDRLTQALANSKRSGHYGALIFLDLDNFKPLNDRHGHAVGDLLLAEVAVRLKGCVREVDTVARFGGDEFVVVLADLAVSQVEAVAQATMITEKIRQTLSQPYNLALELTGQPDTRVQHHCTASIGVCLIRHQDGSEGDFLKWADASMYKAKGAGRNQVHFCVPNGKN
jgi:diguanylate cyclase (GGDEF)-like protein